MGNTFRDALLDESPDYKHRVAIAELKAEMPRFATFAEYEAARAAAEKAIGGAQ